jgi:hypothetical protein
METHEAWNLIIQSITCLGILLVVILAIWGNFFRSWLSGPRLKISLLNSLGELTTLSNNASVRYYHLNVKNKRKWAPARNVRVMLTKVFLRAADGSWIERSFGGPLQLSWQYPQVHVQYPLIGPDDVSELGCIPRGQIFHLTPYVIPNNFNGVVEANQTIKIEVVAVADNGQSKPLYIEIAWNGDWNDDASEMSRHLVVKEVKS